MKELQDLPVDQQKNEAAPNPIGFTSKEDTVFQMPAQHFFNLLMLAERTSVILNSLKQELIASGSIKYYYESDLTDSDQKGQDGTPMKKLRDDFWG